MRDTIYRSYEFDHGRYFGDDFSKTSGDILKKLRSINEILYLQL